MTRGVGGQSPANLAHLLKGIEFPARRQDLVRHAKGNEADPEVIEALEKMPDQEYKSMTDVLKGYGKSH